MPKQNHQSMSCIVCMSYVFIWMMIIVKFVFNYNVFMYLLCIYFSLQALMDSNLPRLQLELYKEIKKVNQIAFSLWDLDVFSPGTKVCLAFFRDAPKCWPQKIIGGKWHFRFFMAENMSGKYMPPNFCPILLRYFQ